MPAKKSTNAPGAGKKPRQGSAQARRSASDSAGAESVIQCAALSKVFRDFWLRDRVCAVDAVDLEVRRSEVFGLLGPNGSGKSTTIKMILGLLYPTAGRVTVFGKLPDDVATKKRIGFLPEESNLYPFLNARETLDYYGRLFGQPRRQRQKRIDMLLEMVGLEAVATRPVGRYSKGMQRRIGLAQALINDPQLLILDEPTSGLDPVGTRQIKDLILELARRRKTVLLCSHLLADVEDVCDRVAIMFGGRVRATGSVDQLLIRQDATTIYSSALSEDVVQKVGAVLHAYGKRIEKVEKPRQKLESLFLEIIRRAQKEGAATSGAGSGGKIADFLLEDQPSRDVSRGDRGTRGIDRAASVIDGLVQAGGGQTKETAPPPGGPSSSQPQPIAEPETITELESIASPAGVPGSEQSGVDEAGDLSVIEGLMNLSPVAPEQEPDQEKEPVFVESSPDAAAGAPVPVELSPNPVDEPPAHDNAPVPDDTPMLNDIIAQQYEMEVHGSEGEPQPTGLDSQADVPALAGDDVGLPSETEQPGPVDVSQGDSRKDRPASSREVAAGASSSDEDDEAPYSYFLEAMDEVPPFIPEKDNE